MPIGQSILYRVNNYLYLSVSIFQGVREHSLLGTLRLERSNAFWPTKQLTTKLKRTSYGLVITPLQYVEVVLII